MKRRQNQNEALVSAGLEERSGSREGVGQTERKFSMWWGQAGGRKGAGGSCGWECGHMRPGASDRLTSTAQPGITAPGWVLSSRTLSSGEWPRWAQEGLAALNWTEPQPRNQRTHRPGDNHHEALGQAGAGSRGAVREVWVERDGERERAEAARSSRRQPAGKDEDWWRDQTVSCSALLNHLLSCLPLPLPRGSAGWIEASE